MGQHITISINLVKIWIFVKRFLFFFLCRSKAPLHEGMIIAKMGNEKKNILEMPHGCSAHGINIKSDLVQILVVQNVSAVKKKGWFLHFVIDFPVV